MKQNKSLLLICLTLFTVFAAFAQQYDMVWIPAGTFTRGSSDDFDWIGPAHQVTLTSGFWMGIYQVTQEQYIAVMGSNPSYFHGGNGREPAVGEVQGRRPVEQVSWYDAIVFCNRLSIIEGLSPVYSINGSTDPDIWGPVPANRSRAWDNVQIVAGSNGYRLPTEAQWEYAARGGNGSPGSFTYSGSNNPGDVAWYRANSNSMTHEVGLKQPNSLGLYDMSGNVWELCWDRYGSYSSGAQTDPMGASSGIKRMARGGNWVDASTDVLRSVYRDYGNPWGRAYTVGLRLVRP